jgi:hypothetical protein
MILKQKFPSVGLAMTLRDTLSIPRNRGVMYNRRSDYGVICPIDGR